MTSTKKGIAVFLVFLIIAGTAAFGVYRLTIPHCSPSSDTVRIILSRGQTVGYIAHQLEKQRVIPSAKAFLLWLKITGKDKNIHAGEYTFSPCSGLFAAAERLKEPRPVEKQVTIPEGLIIEHTAAQIAEVLPIDTTRFVSLCKDPEFISDLAIKANTLEGYLFPETYRFPPDITEEQIIRKMVATFEKTFSQLTPGPPRKVTLNKHQIVTLASIIEKEAVLKEEQTRISGVFYNRLEKRYPLGADPTVRYAIKKFSGPLRVSELKNKSPYNTRVHRGLPPGPICSPGAGALQAAVAPMDTRELYFVAKWDGSGAHDFSLSMIEHNRKKLKIREENNKRIRQQKRKSQ